MRVDDIVTKKVMGIPVEWGNETSVEIIFEKEGAPELRLIGTENPAKKENDFFYDEFEITYDFDVMTITHFYFTLTNVFASLGGILALAGGVVGQVTTLITFSFFWQFGKAIKNIARFDNDILKINRLRKQLRDSLPLTPNPDTSISIRKQNQNSNSDDKAVSSYNKQLYDQYTAEIMKILNT